MVLSDSLSNRIIIAARQYVGHQYVRNKFDCAHFVISVYDDVGIEVPRLDGDEYPPTDFNLSPEEFARMPLGHSVFFRRKTSLSQRIWTHIAIITSPHDLTHCSRHFGGKVVITPKVEFMRTYILIPQPPV